MIRRFSLLSNLTVKMTFIKASNIKCGLVLQMGIRDWILHMKMHRIGRLRKAANVHCFFSFRYVLYFNADCDYISGSWVFGLTIASKQLW